MGYTMKEIPLSQGKMALVDDEDYAMLMGYKWCVRLANHGNLYAFRIELVNGRNRGIHMHRVLLKAPDHYQVDHINGNGLDNRKSNLRLCTQSQNMHNESQHSTNTTGYKGVRRDKRKLARGSRCYSARITVDKKSYSCGMFKTAEEAAHAFDEMAIRHVGKFARLNFPEQPRRDVA